MKGPYDGRLVEYTFGTEEYYQWRFKATSLGRAIRAFRVGALFPHKFVDREFRIKQEGLGPDGCRKDLYLTSKPGAMVVVRVYDTTEIPPTEEEKKNFYHRTKQVGWVEVARITPEGGEAEDYTFQILPPIVQAQLAGGPVGEESTALATVDQGSALLGLDRARRVRKMAEAILAKELTGALR